MGERRSLSWDLTFILGTQLVTLGTGYWAQLHMLSTALLGTAGCSWAQLGCCGAVALGAVMGTACGGCCDDGC